jgi:hypothetical protein
VSKVQQVLVDRRDGPLIEGRHIFKRCEKLPILTEANVGMAPQTLKKIGVAIDIANAEARRIVRFEALTKRQAQRNVALRVSRREWDIFEGVEGLGPQSGVGKRRPILLPAIGLDCRPRG